MSYTAHAVKSFREKQLHETLDFAFKNSEFYKGHLSGYLTKVETLEDLRELPTLTRPIFAANSLKMITSDTFPARIGVTSGGGFDPIDPNSCDRLLQSFQSDDEKLAWQRLRADRLKERKEISNGLAIQLLSVMHGVEFNVPVPGTLSVPFATQFHFAHIVKLLSTRFNFKDFPSRVNYILASTQHLKTLAALLLRDHHELLKTLNLKAVCAYAWALTPHWRGVFQDVFSAPIISLYGMSEIPGSYATECAACGGFHFSPIVVPEVLPIGTDDTQLEHGLGELTLTGLAPFCQYQPIIRYRTGDLVEILPPCPAIHDMGFRFRGRVERSIISDGKVAFCSGDIFSILDSVPGVARSAVFDLDSFKLVGAHGLPKYQVARKWRRAGLIDHVELSLELNFHPDFYKDAANAIKSQIEQALRSCCPSDAEIRICLVPPGSLLPSAGKLE